MNSREPRLGRATIVGAGRMGVGIAENFLIGGLTVRFTDASPEMTRAAAERLVERMRGHAAAGLIDDEDAARAATAVAEDSISAAVADADLIIEAVTEDIDVKRDVLGMIDANAPAGAIITSNTSSLGINELERFVSRPGQFLGMHWFNPPEWTPGVEVIARPSRPTRRWSSGWWGSCARSGKRPPMVKASTGFVANRLQMALFCEAVALCGGRARLARRQIDEVVRSHFGFRLPYFGPFQIADMAGLDVYEAVWRSTAGLGERFLVPALLRERVATPAERHGSGGGFYDYAEGEPERLLANAMPLRRARPAAARSPPLASTATGGAIVELDVLVVGGGAIGGSTAALMTGRVRASWCSTPTRARRAHARPGAELDDSANAARVKLDAYAVGRRAAGEFDFALSRSRHADRGRAARLSRDLVETLVSLGNGLVHDRIAAIVGRERLLIGTVEWARPTWARAPGARRPSPFVIGEPDGQYSERPQRALARALGPVAEVRITDNIRGPAVVEAAGQHALSGLGVAGGCTMARSRLTRKDVRRSSRSGARGTSWEWRRVSASSPSSASRRSAWLRATSASGRPRSR